MRRALASHATQQASGTFVLSGVAQRDNPVTRASSAVISRLKLWLKLGLLVGLLMVPTVFAGFAYLGSVNGTIGFSALEREGIEVIRPALHALTSLAADPQTELDLEPLSAAVSAHPQLELDDDLQAVVDKTSLSGDLGTAAVAAALTDLIAAAGNSSNLVLDPDLDSFYIMDATVFQMPRALESHLEARTHYAMSTGTQSDAVLRGNVANQAVLAGVLSTTAQTLASDVETAASSSQDSQVAGDLAAMTAFSAALTAEAQALRDGLGDPTPSDFAQPAAAATAAIDPSLDALDRLLATRVNALASERDLTIAGISLFTILGLGWAYMVWSNTQFGVNVVLGTVRALAQRDLSPRLRAPGRDEFATISSDLDVARAHLADAFSALAGASSQVAESAAHLTTTSSTVDGSARQTLSQSSAAASNLGGVRDLIEAVSASSVELSDATAEISVTMNQVNAAAQNARSDLHSAANMASALAESSKRIEASVTAIQAIASKTRLLALNATIEAARAGEAGRGFAVVAGEVQGLAQQSADASAEIGAVAQEQHQEIERVIASIREAAQTVAAAADAQATVAAAAQQQTATIAKVTESLSDSATATLRIAQQVSMVESEANNTAGTVAELRAAAHEFDEVAKRLSQHVGAFTLS